MSGREGFRSRETGLGMTAECKVAYHAHVTLGALYVDSDRAGAV